MLKRKLKHRKEQRKPELNDRVKVSSLRGNAGTKKISSSWLGRVFDLAYNRFLVWFKVPKNKILAFRIVLFATNFLLLLGIFIFMWLNFFE
jgi:hypothetical protein